MVVARRSLLDAKGGPVETRKGCPDLSQKNGYIESVIQVLKEQGFEDVPFAIVALDDQGKAQVHTSEQLEPHLDVRLFASKFEEAQTRSLQRGRTASSVFSSPHTLTLGQITKSLNHVEDELVQRQQHALQVASRRERRTARHRGRSTAIPDLLPFSFPYEAPRSPLKDECVVSAVRDHKPVARKPAMISFRVDSEADVTAYLESRLKRLQQLAGKKIAKAWIKGICPKKQARFPYQNHRRFAETGEPPRIPGWWPQLEGVCRFVEPDHIKREERMKLCLHLLRLRPSPQQLKAWNDNTTEHNTTHVRWGWTAFLKELAGPDLFDDLPKEAPNRVKLRQTLLAQMYAVAAMEEQYYKDEIDAGELYFCEEDEEEENKPVISKRSRRASTTSSAEDDSRESSVSFSCTRAKKARRDIEHALGRTESSPGCDSNMIEGNGFDQERCSQWQNEFNPPTQGPDVAVVPVNTTVADRAMTADSRFPWVSVQNHPEMTMIDGPSAWSDQTDSIYSRKRALRAQRKALVDQFDKSSSTVPVKQEIQPSMPTPQVQMKPFHPSGPETWIDTMPDYRATQIDNSTTPYPYPGQHPPPEVMTQQWYDYHQQNAPSMAQTPQSVPSCHMSPVQAPQETHMCLSLDCCPQGSIVTPQYLIMLPFHEFPPPFGSEALGTGMQQSWQQPCPIERYLQPHNDASNNFFNAPTEEMWDHKG